MSLVDFFIALFFCLALLVFYDIRVNIPTFLLLSPLCLAVVLFSTLGCGLILAALNIRYRDVRHVIPFLLQFLFFATPVIFPLSVVKSGTLAFLLSLNPVAAAVHLGRAAISIEAVNWQFSTMGLASSFLILLVGLVAFNRNEIDRSQGKNTAQKTKDRHMLHRRIAGIHSRYCCLHNLNSRPILYNTCLPELDTWVMQHPANSKSSVHSNPLWACSSAMHNRKTNANTERCCRANVCTRKTPCFAILQ